MRTTLGCWWYAFANAVGGFIEEAAFRVVLAWAVLRGKSPKPVEKRAWDKDLEVPTLLDFLDWTTSRHLFSVLVWPSLEVPDDEAYRAQEERAQQVKEVILRGAAEKAWSTGVEVTYGLAWDRQRQAWVARDGFAYALPESVGGANEHAQ